MRIRHRGSQLSRTLGKAALAVLLAGIWPGAGLVGPAAPAQAAYGISKGMGVDGCGITTSEAQALWSNTPYYNFGLYLGGSAAGCPISGSYASTILGQGWSALPLWVGPQAPCSGYRSTFSYDGATAFNQGKTEALSSYNVIHGWGWNTDSAPIIYDLEGFNTGNSSCLNAAKQFISGWTYQMHVAPAQKAGVYGSTCGSGLGSYASIANVPDFIDGADWNGNKSTSNMACIPSDTWVFSQRHKQYQGDHNETWNGVTVTIDSDCSNGPVYPKGDNANEGCV